MKITQDVRAYAAEHGLAEQDAITAGMQEKAAEFSQSGGRMYLPLAAAHQGKGGAGEGGSGRD
jgi:phosphomethylpyrimidine synthase